MLTVFLVIFVAALGLGNVLLHVSSPGKKEGIASTFGSVDFDPSKYKKPAEKPKIEPSLSSQKHEDILYEEVSHLQSNFKVVDELAKMAHNRINDLEKKMIIKENKLNEVRSQDNPDVSSVQGKTNLSSAEIKVLKELNERIKKLDNFKSNTSIELTAIKEIIKEMKERINDGKRNEKLVPDAAFITNEKRKVSAKEMKAAPVSRHENEDKKEIKKEALKKEVPKHEFNIKTKFHYDEKEDKKSIRNTLKLADLKEQIEALRKLSQQDE